MTLVGMYADTSPSWVSMIGSAVSEPPPSWSFSFAARSGARGAGRPRGGPAAELVVQLRRPLEEPRVQVEHVARVRLATGRAAEQQRELPVGGGVLGEVVVDAERVAPGVAG